MESSSSSQGLQSYIQPGTLMASRGSSPRKGTSLLKPELGGWSFIECVGRNSDFTRNRGATEGPNRACSQPGYYSTFPKLSKRSLEMCTESLGSETGDGLSEEISLLSLEDATCWTSNQTPNSKEEDSVKKRSSHKTSFPPPIKSITGSSKGLKVKSYREDGRLVLRAVAVDSSKACFQAERSGGRLRLCLTKDLSCVSDEIGNPCEENEECRHGERAESKEEEEEKDEEDESTEGRSEVVGDTVGSSEKLPGLSRRCKGGESGQRGLLNWETCWVAI